MSNKQLTKTASDTENDEEAEPLIDSSPARNVAAKIIWVVRASELVFQRSERDRRLQIRKIINQALDRKKMQ